MTIKLRGMMREFWSRQSEFEPSFHREKQKWEADIRNWELESDANTPWIYYVKDSNNVITQTTPLDCSCEIYPSLRIGTCMHMEALLRRAVGKIHHHTNTMKHVIYYDSEQNKLVWRQERKTQAISNTKDIDEILVKRPFTVMTEAAKKAWNSLKEENNKEQIRLSRHSSISALGVFQNIFKEQGIQLYQYQVDACVDMITNQRCILALPVGYGKTLASLACIKHIEDTEQRKLKVLVVCPTSLKMQWAKEVKKYLKDKPVVVCTGNKPVQLNMFEFIVVNYESLYRVPGLLEQEFDLLITDEVQKVKNKETKSWLAIKQIKFKMCYALSGTVVENSVNDFISIMEIIDESAVSPRWKFINEFCSYTNHKVRGIKPSKVNDLRDRYKNYIIRCNVPKHLIPTSSIKENKTDVGVIIDKGQKTISDDYFNEAKKLLAIGEHRPLRFYEKIMLNGYLANARMSANDVRLVNKNSPSVSIKTQQISSTIMKHTTMGEKVVVFSEWIEYLKLIAIELGTNNIGFVHYDGRLNIKKKNIQLNAFQTDPKVMVFLSTDTGGVGLDGLQLAANTIIHCETVWNPSKLVQRNGRLIRIGQKQPTVNIYNFYSKDTIEDKMVLVNNARKELIRQNIVS